MKSERIYSTMMILMWLWIVTFPLRMFLGWGSVLDQQSVLQVILRVLAWLGGGSILLLCGMMNLARLARDPTRPSLQPAVGQLALALGLIIYGIWKVWLRDNMPVAIMVVDWVLFMVGGCLIHREISKI